MLIVAKRVSWCSQAFQEIELLTFSPCAFNSGSQFGDKPLNSSGLTIGSQMAFDKVSTSSTALRKDQQQPPLPCEEISDWLSGAVSSLLPLAIIYFFILCSLCSPLPPKKIKKDVYINKLWKEDRTTEKYAHEARESPQYKKLIFIWLFPGVWHNKQYTNN